MADHHSVQLPHDLIGTIAAVVASDPHEYRRTQTLAACMLVCRSFAPEFRQHLFETFSIRDDDYSEDVDGVGNRLSTHAQVLEDHPEYRDMVKTVTIVLAPYAPSVVQDSRFPLWLKGLTSVTELILATYDEAVDFAGIPKRSRSAIIQLCSLPSLRRFHFDDTYNLPPHLFCDAPNLDYLSLGSITVDSSFQQHNLSEDDLKQIASTKPRVHLQLHHTVGQEVPRTLQALVPIVVRIWKLSGKYESMGEVVLISMCMAGAREPLRELDFTLCDDPDYNDDEELNMPPVVIMPAKNLERLSIKFMHSLSKPPSGGEPNLSALLEHISIPFSGAHRNELGVLDKLSTITIEIHDIPARCLREEGIKNDQEMWDRLDGALSREGGYVPNVEQLELTLFLRWGESMADEDTQAAVSRLLPSLPSTVRKITISSAETFY